MKRYLPIITVCLFLSACTTPQIDLDSEGHAEILQEDQQKLDFDQAQGQTVSLSLGQSLTRGINYNLDARVSALEVLAQSDQIDLARLGAFPALDFSFNYIGRSNPGASSSQSVLTGTQSLEPSFSTTPYRDTQDLTMRWNFLNILLAVSQTQNAKNETLIAAERHQKVIQNIQKDVYAAYWRAYAAQETQKTTKSLIKQGEKHLQQLSAADKGNLLSRATAYERALEMRSALTSLQDLQNQTSLAMLELKSLLSFPQDATLILTTTPPPHQQNIHKLLSENLETLETEALQNRPEVRELILQKNLSAQSYRDEILRSMPGGELFFGFNRDSNEFLQDSNWANFSLSVTQSLMSLVTLPIRQRAARNQQEIDDARRRALTLAIMTQVHLSRQQLDYAQNVYKSRKKISENARFLSVAAAKRAGTGFETRQKAFLQKVTTQVRMIESYQSLAELQDAYAGLHNTLARDTLTNP